MKAIGLTHYLPIEDLRSLFDLEIEKPVPTGRDILVKVKAIAVNPIDVKVRAPKDKVEETPRIIGWDAAGVVDAVGSNTSLFKVGDEVYYAGDIRRPGSNAEYQLVDERIVGSKPASLTFADAAALPLTTITAYESLFDRLRIELDGQNSDVTLLIIGGAGGVGSMAIQLAKLAGLRVIATASRPESTAWVTARGADDVINHREPLRQQIEALGLDFVDYVAIYNDTDGHWSAVTDLIAPQGHVVSIVENAKPLSQEMMKTKAATFSWELMFTRAMFETPDMIEQHRLLNHVAALIEHGDLKTTANKAIKPINAKNLREAHRLLESGQTIGKITLEGWS